MRSGGYVSGKFHATAALPPVGRNLWRRDRRGYVSGKFRGTAALPTWEGICGDGTGEVT